MTNYVDVQIHIHKHTYIKDNHEEIVYIGWFSAAMLRRVLGRWDDGTMAVVRRGRDEGMGEIPRQKSRRMMTAYDPRFNIALASISALSRHVVMKQELSLPL